MRCDYSDECYDAWASIRWSGALKSGIRGKRGQLFLKRLLEVLESMPTQELISNKLEVDGQFCALGAIGHDMGHDMSEFDIDDTERLCEIFDISDALLREIMFINDGYLLSLTQDTPYGRWVKVKLWVSENINK